jgi:hypothetical protein
MGKMGRTPLSVSNAFFVDGRGECRWFAAAGHDPDLNEKRLAEPAVLYDERFPIEPLEYDARHRTRDESAKLTTHRVYQPKFAPFQSRVPTPPIVFSAIIKYQVDPRSGIRALLDRCIVHTRAKITAIYGPEFIDFLRFGNRLRKNAEREKT